MKNFQKAADNLPIDCQIHIPHFEGPLDLLLHLIKSHEVDIVDLSISKITQQYLGYLDYMRELNLDLASEYLVMAATLTLLKSQVILPQEKQEEATGPDPRKGLIAQLLQLKCYKELAQSLEERPRINRDFFFGKTDVLSDIKKDQEPEVALSNSYQLIEAYRDLIYRRKEIVHEVYEDTVPVKDCIYTIVDSLKTKETLLLSDLLPNPSKNQHLISNFLGALELTKLQIIQLDQTDVFGPITLSRKMTKEELSELNRETLSLSW